MALVMMPPVPPLLRPRRDIRAVAREAGVSVSTVSRALNGYADVNADTRQRVQEAAERLGYRASHAATTLRSSQTNTVTFMVSKPWTKFVDPYFLAIIDGLELALSAQGLDLQVIMARDYDSEIDVIRRTVERNRSDALIFARTRPEDERIDWLEEQGFPFITIGRTLRNSHSFVDRDQVRVGHDSARRLAALGHSKIALLATPLRYTYSHLTRQGIQQGLEEAGLAYDPALEIECFLSRRTGEEAVTELFMRGQRPTALVCGNDQIAMSAMEGLRRLALKPGEDVAIIGCDDIPVAAHLRPALTTFSTDLEALGIRLGQMVLARLGGDATVRQELVPAQMVIRLSDCPGPRDEG
jgi:LacI family transcriptional regulator